MYCHRKTAIFFSSAKCNLNCKYCNIEKIPEIQKIEQLLEESYKGDYYINQVKKFFTNEASLERIEFWGGETSMGLDRVTPLVHQIINNYPYFYEIFFSTNFSYPEWNNNIKNFLNIFRQYPNRIFNITLQLSCDGPTYINDFGRGDGVTEKCLNNFNYLIDNIETILPTNVILLLALKPTLSMETIEQLNTKEKIIEYYKFFEDNFYIKSESKGYNNLKTNISIPNLAVPIAGSYQTGVLFKNFCKMTREIEQQHKKHRIFDFYEKITPFEHDKSKLSSDEYYCTYFCGLGSTNIGFLPNNLLSICNEGFTQLITEYTKYLNSEERSKKLINTNTFQSLESKSSLCLTEEEYLKYEKHVKGFGINDAKSYKTNIMLEIMTLALAKQIDKKYLDYNNAAIAADFFCGHFGCPKDNFNVTGSKTMLSLGELRTFLNGALDYIIYEE